MDIASLLKGSDSSESAAPVAQHSRSSSVSLQAITTPTTAPIPLFAPNVPPPGAPGLAGTRKRLMPPPSSESPAKKKDKWSPEEDALIIELRGSGMKWEDISKRLPGRSAISCRLHYQNYLERRSEWDEERKTKLARLYDRFKSEMWARIAEELAVPWRAAEAMHWQLGEADMARRAGTRPFSLTAVNVDQSHGAWNRGQAYSQSQGSLPQDADAHQRYGISVVPPRTLSDGGESCPPPPPPPGLKMFDMNDDHKPSKFNLAPIPNRPSSRAGGKALPGFAELAGLPAGVSRTSAFSTAVPPVSLLPSFTHLPPQESIGSKKRPSPGSEGSRATSRRRPFNPRQEEVERHTWQ